MPLCNEDNLRLNVLLRQNLYALRIDESKMFIFALTERGEAQIALNANCRDEKYVGMIKETISTYVLGSPIGYPVYIHRWTRMGQTRKIKSLQNLLKLGEPEAVVAVANTQDLPVEIARHVWWALPTEDVARTLLRHQSVIEDDLGQQLALFLMEFLPFESEALRIVETVSLLLQPGVLSEDDRQLLWKKASHKSAYYPGFLITAVDDLPHKVAEHKRYADLSQQLASVIEQGNAVAQHYLWCHSETGQSVFNIIKLALKRPSQQDVVVTLFNAIGHQFAGLGLSRSFRSIDELQLFNSALCDLENNSKSNHLLDQIRQLDALIPDCEDRILAMLSLAQMSETLLDPLFGGTDCLGSVMRKRIKPVSEPLLEMVARLEDG
jgi:hypothetical protein